MQSSEKEIVELHNRLQGMETRQQQMMSFLAKALQNPQFLQQVLSAHQPSRLTSGRHLPNLKAVHLPGNRSTGFLATTAS